MAEKEQKNLKGMVKNGKYLVPLNQMLLSYEELLMCLVSTDYKLREE